MAAIIDQHRREAQECIAALTRQRTHQESTQSNPVSPASKSVGCDSDARRAVRRPATNNLADNLIRHMLTFEKVSEIKFHDIFAMESPTQGNGEELSSTVEVTISEEDAARIEEVREMLLRPSLSSPPSASLEELLAASGAPLRVEHTADKGRRVIATRAIAAGELILAEEAAALFLCRNPGSDVVFSMTISTPPMETDAKEARLPPRMLCTLTPWPRLRTLRDSLTLAPRFRGRAEEAFALLSQLTALGGQEHSAWGALPILPPGAVSDEEREEAGGDEALLSVPIRAQLLHAISQCNGFAVALPEEDSLWRRNLLWPLLARLALPSDRERLFDEGAEGDAPPLSYVTGFFALASLFNHACGSAANVSYSNCVWAEGAEFPTVSMRAIRAIQEGEECSICYLAAPCDKTLPVKVRRHRLLFTYRFECTCYECVMEEPRAGGEGDPLRGHFPCGAGVEGVASFFEGNGRYPKLIV